MTIAVVLTVPIVPSPWAWPKFSQNFLLSSACRRVVEYTFAL